ARARLERIAAGVEEHVGHIHDKAARRIARLQDGIQLRKELRTKLSLFGFGLRSCLARFLGFGFGGALLGYGGFALVCGLFGFGLCGLLLRSRGGASLVGFLF